MKVKVLIMSLIAITGVSVLLFSGVNASDKGRDDGERYERGERYEKREQHEYARELKEQGKIMPLQDIISRATERHPGRVIETELEREDGGFVYEIEVLDKDGKVWELEYDAVTGDMLKEKQDD